MKLVTVVVLLVSLTACEDREVFFAEKQKNFIQCMELAAKNQRTADDDVSDIVDSYQSAAANLTSLWEN
jgi:hypothetical protein